ncbi:MAG: hypothetical protein HY433_01420 [Candidatus Liptonbacteria bacterium]|nr:hypothetical protein [Candidatus Liptonbacteria bacterium]
MRFHKKAAAWARELKHIFRGASLNIIHREPPAHYLGYTVAGKVPVILIPGIFSRWGYMKHLGDAISLRGHPVYIIPELHNNLFSVPSSAKILRSLITHIVPMSGHIVSRTSRSAETIRKFIQEKGLKDVIIVAHSKGGLIGKYFLVHHNADRRVLGMIAVATPFSGSALAKLIPHGAFKELMTDSKVIHDLKTHKEVNKNIVSIFPEYDTQIWAERGSFLDGAENIEIPVAGHTVLFDKKIHDAVINAIDKMTSAVNSVRYNT